MSQWQLPAVVVALLAWLAAPSESLGDLARKEAFRRAVTQKSARTLFTDDLPALSITPVSIPVSTTVPDETVSGQPPAAAAAAAAAGGGAEKTQAKDEKWWRDQMTQARQALERDKLLAESVQGRVNSLTNDTINRDDPAQRALAATNRQKALAELDRLQKQIKEDEKTIQQIQTDARRQGVPPGWIR